MDVNEEGDNIYMLSIKIEPPSAESTANFDRNFMGSKDLQDFTLKCGVELRAAVVAAIVSTRDEYMRLVREIHPVADDLKKKLEQELVRFTENITEDEIEMFRNR